MATDKLSQAAFARYAGVKPQAVTKAIKQGRLILYGEGRQSYIDLREPSTQAYLRGDVYQRPSARAQKAAQSTKTPTPTAKKEAQNKPKVKKKTPQMHNNKEKNPPIKKPEIESETPSPEKKKKPRPTKKPKSESEAREPSNQAQVEAYLETEDIKRQKVRAELEKLRISNEEKRGNLLPKNLVQVFIHKLHEIDQAQWKTLGLKISSDVAASLGIDDDEKIRQACDIIDREIVTVLKQVKREQNKFLKQIKADKIK